MEPTTTPQAQTLAVEEPSQAIQPVAEQTTSVPAPEATEPVQAGEAQAAEPKVSNAEKRQERTRKAFSELLAEKRAVEQENQALKTSPVAETPQTTAQPTQPTVSEPPTLAPNADGEITGKEIEAYTKAMSEYAAKQAAAPLQEENVRLREQLEQTQGNVNKLSTAEIIKQDATDARDLLSKYDILDQEKPDVFDKELTDDLLSKFNALRTVQPTLRLKDYFESEMGALEAYAERIAARQNTQQDKLAAEAPVESEGAAKTPELKSLHWKDLEKKIGFA